MKHCQRHGPASDPYCVDCYKDERERTASGPLDAVTCSAVLLTSVNMYDGDGWMPILTVDHQSFTIDYIAENKSDCDWYCDQMRSALERAGCRIIGPNV